MMIYMAHKTLTVFIFFFYLFNEKYYVSLNSSARLQTSLDLLHTLWFTLQSPDKESGRVTEEEKPRRPPNLAPECSLVCWTLLEQLR